MLKGKTALITGASRGIGRAIARCFAAQGANVALVYAGNAEAAQSTLEELLAAGCNAKAYRCNVCSAEETAALVKQVVEDFGRVEILVNNAGITRDNLLLKMPEEDFDAVIDTNLKGAFNMVKGLYSHLMRNRWGRVIHIGSVVGQNGNAGQANYAASKAGLAGFCKSVAKELGARGVTCNVIQPGFIQTQMTEALSGPVREKYLANIPARRFGEAGEVAALAAFLASDAAGYITGQVINVDGGMCM